MNKRVVLGVIFTIGAVFFIPKISYAATLKITLPPMAISTPQSLKFGTETFIFQENCQGGDPCFKKLDNADTTKVTASRITDLQSGLVYYQVQVNNISKGAGQLAFINHAIERFNSGFNPSARAYNPPPASNFCLMFRRCGSITNRTSPWGWKLTFKPKTTADLVALAQRTPQISTGSFSLAQDKACSIVPPTGQDPGYACLTSKVVLETEEGHNVPTQSLKQSIQIPAPGQVIIEGNVAGGFGLSNFSVDSPSSLVLGGDIVNVDNGIQLKKYLESGSSLQWNDGLTGKLQNSFDDLLKKAAKVSPVPASSWNLNSEDGDPNNPISTTSSTPPEGKLWKNDGDLTLQNRIIFSGAGTVLVKGNLTLKGASCTEGTRLGFVVTGNITFTDNAINCGAYLSLGSLSFASPQNSTIETKGIFVAKGNISVPKVAPGSNMRIKYDTVFGQNPTDYFIEALKLIFKTTS